MQKYAITELNKVKRGSKRATYDVETINTILDAGFVAQVSYIFKGKAISLPMAYGRIDDKIYLHGSRKNRMLLALLEAKEASICVMHLDGLVLARSGFHHSVNYRSATIFGATKAIEAPELKTQALKCMMDQMIPNRWEHLRPMTPKEFDATLVIEIAIETASAKIRNEGVHDEKSDVDFPVWAGVIPIKQTADAPIDDDLLLKSISTPDHIKTYYDVNK